MVLWHYELTTLMGPMRAAFDGRGRLLELAVEGLDPRKTSPLPPREQREAKRYLDRQLDAYLAGTLRTFTVPVDPQGSPLQQRIWDLQRARQGVAVGEASLSSSMRLDGWSSTTSKTTSAPGLMFVTSIPKTGCGSQNMDHRAGSIAE